MKKRITLMRVAVLAISMLAGCGSNKAAGSVATGGSTSMEKVIGDLGESFRNDAGISFTYNPTGSGTRDGFESITDTEDACKYRQELTSTGGVITTVAQNPGAIGYASVASVKDTVKALVVDGAAPTRLPSKTAAMSYSAPSFW